MRNIPSISIILILSLSLQAAEWTQWRGPTRDGHVPSNAQLPSTVDESNLPQAWRAELSDGYSSPIVSEDAVFTVETHKKKSEIVRAFHRETGKQLWETSWTGAMKVPFFAAKNGSWARSTPALYDDRLYVAGMRDLLVCLDAKNGKVLWKVDFTERYGTPLPSFGFVCSPLVDATGVYVQAGGGVIKLDRITGKEIWRGMTDGGGMGGSAFSSPIIAPLAGVQQLIIQSRSKLMGAEPSTGKKLWEIDIPAFRGMNIVTPTVYKDAVFTSSYGGGTFLIDVKRDATGRWTAVTRWKTALQGYMSSPVIIGDFAYWHLKNARIACYDLRTGEQAWRSKKSFGKYVSMIVKDDQALALDERGTLFLFKLSPEKLEILSERKVSKDDAWAHVTTCDKQVFIREQRAIAVYNFAD